MERREEGNCELTGKSMDLLRIVVKQNEEALIFG